VDHLLYTKRLANSTNIFENLESFKEKVARTKSRSVNRQGSAHDYVSYPALKSGSFALQRQDSIPQVLRSPQSPHASARSAVCFCAAFAIPAGRSFGNLIRAMRIED